MARTSGLSPATQTAIPPGLLAVVNELLSIPVDVLYVSPRAENATTKATKKTPIICPELSNPTRDRTVAELARPGGNLTGLYSLTTETLTKRLELTLELRPGLKHIGVLFDGNHSSMAADADDLGKLINSRGLVPHMLEVGNLSEIQAALKRMQRLRIEALIVLDSALVELHQAFIMTAVGNQFPVVSEGKDWAKDGALLTYGHDSYDMWRRSATYVDRVLKGAKPADLPVEQATKFYLVVNLKTAKALGITIPESILLRADEVIR